MLCPVRQLFKNCCSYHFAAHASSRRLLFDKISLMLNNHHSSFSFISAAFRAKP